MIHADEPTSEDLCLPGGRVLPLRLLQITCVRSSGPGGQNVNKLATKVQLRLNLAEALPILGEAATQRLRHLAGSRLTLEDHLLLSEDSSRSQHANRAACIERLRRLLVEALHRPRIRRATRPTRASRERRLAGKQHRSRLKRDRQPPPGA